MLTPFQMVNCTDLDDKTALHYAIEAMNLSAVQLLIKEGMNLASCYPTL
jgi:ankyrin repeat protein